jgi:HAD superfamily hydrolase (TIGR01509 family)
MLQDKHIFQATQLESSSVISVGTPQELQEYVNNTNVFLFDLDGTLIETDEIYFQIWKVLLQPYNIDIDKNQFNNVIMGNNDKHVCDVLLSNVPNINIDDISKLKDKLFIEHIQNIGEIKTVKNAQEFLKEARKKYIPCSIVTNCNRKCAEAIVKILDIEKYIDFIIVGNECERTKPFPDPYITAIKKYNVRPDQVVIFEDSKSGLLSARSVSPKCLVGIETFYTNSELTQLGADISVKSFENFFVDTLLQFISVMNLDNKNLVNWILNTVKNTVPDVEKQHILINPIKLKGGYIADVLSVSIETPQGIISCVLKMENPMETPMTSVATSLDLYNREYMFYESISNAFDFSIPKFYGLVKNNEKNIGILLENLYDGSPSNKLNCNLNKNPHYAYHIIKSMAKMHVHFWNRELKQEFPFLRNTVDPLFCPSWNEFINKRKDLFKKNWCHVLSSSQMTMVDRICDNFSHIQENLANNNQTLIHGDIKSPNIFYNTETNTPFFIDWQYVGIGKGVQDLIFFLIESFDTDVLQTRFHELCSLYFTEVNKNPNVNYKREDFNRDLQNAVCYFPFFVAVWFGTVPSEDLIDKEFPLQFIKKLFFVFTTFFHNL